MAAMPPMAARSKKADPDSLAETFEKRTKDELIKVYSLKFGLVLCNNRDALTPTTFVTIVRRWAKT